jgi:RNA polymerase sigma factor (sigma-70 family)
MANQIASAEEGREEPAARPAPPSLGARIRGARFARECERLRPLGEAYVLRRFAGQIGPVDAEDAVSEVLIRLHRQHAEGRAPRNLQAAFFTAVRNAAIDLLRFRAAKPTVALEAALAMPTTEPPPSERAEAGDEAMRLREALGRMRGNYREAVLMRFGLEFSVPEIAAQLQISVPAAKKLVLRATRQARERMERIEAAEFCEETRRFARDSLFDKEATGLASETESEVLHAHLSHCGACRSYMLALREHLHDLGSAALLVLAGGDHHAGALTLFDRLSGWLGGASERLDTGLARGRELALRASGASGSGEGPAGLVLGSGQKIAALCGAGAAATACVLGPTVGAGIGTDAPPSRHPPAKIKTHEPQAPALLPSVAPAPGEAEAPASTPASGGQSPSPARQSPSPSEFSLEPTPSSAPSPPLGGEGEASASPAPAPGQAGTQPASSSPGVGFQG